MRRSRVAFSLFATIAAVWCGTAQAQLNPDVQRAMHELARAAEGDNRAAFLQALTHARSVVASSPSGSEKSAAQKSLQVYGDIDRLWSYADASPTGAFFDATSENGGLLSIAKRYPGWARAVADDTLTSGGRTIYPTRETRKFLAKLAANPRVAQVSQPAPAAVKKKKAAAVWSAAATPPLSHEKKSGGTAAALQTATAAPPPAVVTTTAPPPPPPPPPTTTTVEPPPTTTTTAAPPAAPKEQGSSVNMIVAIVLVIIGVGMAVVLFRASD